MSRSNWKGYYFNPYLLSKRFQNNNKKIVWARNSTITESLIGQTIFIHNGKDFVKTFVTREKIGFKFGDFAHTRKIYKKN